MRVGLDLLYLIPGETGGRETYARELVAALLDHASGLELVAFVNRDAGGSLAGELGDGVRAVVLPVSARSRPQWAIGELALVPIAAQRAGVEVLHSMANFAPPRGRFARVVTIHDLQYRAVPDLMAAPGRIATGAMVSTAARGAHRIIAVSNAGGEEIATGLGVARERIDVIPNGVRPPPASRPDGDARERHGLAERQVVLTVATNLAHKNLASLIDALADIDAERRPVLVLAGHGTDDGSLAARARTAGVEADLRLLGGRTAAELESLYAVADCLVLPSLHEGFGLPVLEAMARAVPVACSDIAALREVAGEAAVLFDPGAPAQIADAIRRILSDRELAARLVALGLAQAARYSWADCAAATLASYERALAARR